MEKKDLLAKNLRKGSFWVEKSQNVRFITSKYQTTRIVRLGK